MGICYPAVYIELDVRPGTWKRSVRLPCWHTGNVTCTPLPSANKAADSGCETQKRCHQKSKTGVSVPHKKDLCPPKIKKKELDVLFSNI